MLRDRHVGRGQSAGIPVESVKLEIEETEIGLAKYLLVQSLFALAKPADAEKAGGAERRRDTEQQRDPAVASRAPRQRDQPDRPPARDSARCHVAIQLFDRGRERADIA